MTSYAEVVPELRERLDDVMTLLAELREADKNIKMQLAEKEIRITGLEVALQQAHKLIAQRDAEISTLRSDEE